MGEYIYLLIGLGLGIAFFAALYFFKNGRSGKDVGHSWMSYILLWPLILDADKDKRKGRLLTKREWIGWGLVCLLIVIAIIFTLSRRVG